MSAHPEFSQFFPAAIGTYLLDYGWHDLELWVVRTPVLAWAIMSSGFAEPITMHGIRPLDAYPPVVLHPDGTVQHIDELFPTYDRWLEVVRWEKQQDPGVETNLVN